MTGAGSLLSLQEASFAAADGALRGSWLPERAMGGAELESFLDERTYCVLATTTAKGRPQARPIAFAVLDAAFWFATVSGGRLRNLIRSPWGSVVISEGEGEEHRVVAADGPVAIVSEPAPGLLELWERRLGSTPDWAVAWLELRPERLYSYTRA